MKKKFFISSVILFSTILCGPLSSLAYSSQGKNFEVFISGKRYGSFYEYKVKRLKSSLKMEFLSSKFNNFKEFKKDVLNGFEEDDYNGVSRESLINILQELDPENLGGLNTDLSDIKEMQGMLNDYNRFHKAGSIIIDPEKMRTIVIDPSEDRKADTDEK